MHAVDVPGTEDNGAGEGGIALQHEPAHPAALAEAGHVDPFRVEVVFGGEVTAGGVENLPLVLKGLPGVGKGPLLAVGHPHHEPVLSAGMGPNELGGGFSPGAVVVEDGGPLTALVVVLREGDGEALAQLGEAQLEALGRRREGRGERKENHGQTHRTHGRSRGGRYKVKMRGRARLY